MTGIIDEIVSPKSRDSGPSVGEYYLYAAFNRMVDATSKGTLPEWFSHTAIQSIRANDIQAPDSTTSRSCPATPSRYWPSAKRTKEGWDWLKQIGLALLVDRQTRLPFFYREY